MPVRNACAKVVRDEFPECNARTASGVHSQPFTWRLGGVDFDRETMVLNPQKMRTALCNPPQVSLQQCRGSGGRDDCSSPQRINEPCYQSRALDPDKVIDHSQSIPVGPVTFPRLPGIPCCLPQLRAQVTTQFIASP